MKRLASILVSFVLICGAVNIHSVLAYDYYEQQYPGYGEYITGMYSAVDSGFIRYYDGTKMSSEIGSQTATEMINSLWREYALDSDDPTTKQLLDKYSDSNNTYITVFDENILNEALIFRFGLDLNTVWNAVKSESYNRSIRTDGYVLMQPCGRGSFDPTASLVIDSIENISEDIIYGQWHFVCDNGYTYPKAYAVMKKGMVHGEEIVGYMYLSYDPPTDEYLNSLGKKEPEISVILNDSKLEFDQPPVTHNYRTMVPIRKIVEALGAEVSWNNDTETASITKGSINVKITIGNSTIYSNGREIITDTPAMILNDRTLVPVRFISEIFGCAVDWNEESKTVSITEHSEFDKSKILKCVQIDFDKDNVKENVYFVGESYYDDYYGVDMYRCDVYYENDLIISDKDIIVDTIKTIKHSDINHLYFQTRAAVQEPTYVIGKKNGEPHFYFYGNICAEFDENNLFKGFVTWTENDGEGRHFKDYTYKWNGESYVEK